jgi:hypothetical protein
LLISKIVFCNGADHTGKEAAFHGGAVMTLLIQAMVEGVLDLADL